MRGLDAEIFPGGGGGKGAIWGLDKRGGEAYVRCYTLHLLGGEYDHKGGGGGQMLLPAPLHTALV